MTRLVPVRDIAHLRLVPPADERWLHGLSWIPVSATEFHLACHYYPIAIRFEDRKPHLGLIVDPRYMARPLLDATGAWRGAYRPIALRCFPFEAPNVGNDPLSDILIDPASEYLSKTAGHPIVDSDGHPGRQLTEVHRLFGLLQHGRESFATALDQYLIGGLLAPLPGAGEATDDGDTPFYVIDPDRLSHLEPRALGAMARHGFTSVDIAVACHFSLRNLRPECRPKDAGQSPRRRSASAMAPEVFAIDDLSLALDDSELIALWDIDALRIDARA